MERVWDLIVGEQRGNSQTHCFSERHQCNPLNSMNSNKNGCHRIELWTGWVYETDTCCDCWERLQQKMVGHERRLFLIDVAAVDKNGATGWTKALRSRTMSWWLELVFNRFGSLVGTDRPARGPVWSTQCLLPTIGCNSRLRAKTEPRWSGRAVWTRTGSGSSWCDGRRRRLRRTAERWSMKWTLWA